MALHLAGLTEQPRASRGKKGVSKGERNRRFRSPLGCGTGREQQFDAPRRMRTPAVECQQSRSILRSGCQELENPLDGIVGVPKGRLDFGGRLRFRIRRCIEKAIGERATDTLVKQDEQQGSLVAFSR